MYQSLIQDNEMQWLGIDLSRTPFEVLGDGVGAALPYLLMVVLVAGLGWYQQRQIQGRMTGEVSSQQQIIMKVLPWMLPIFSFTMPGGLVLYFIVSAILRIAQQAYITRAVYQNDELNAPIDFNNDDEDEDDDDEDDEPENPLAALFGGGGGGSKTKETAPSARHGSRRPTTGASPKKRTRPPRTEVAEPVKKTRSSNKKLSAGSEPAEKVSGWGRAKRSAPTNQTPEKPVSRRVTPKGDSPSNRRGKK